MKMLPHAPTPARLKHELRDLKAELRWWCKRGLSSDWFAKNADTRIAKIRARIELIESLLNVEKK